MFVCNAPHLRTITSVVVAAVIVSSPGEVLAGKSPRRAASEPGAAAVAEPAAVPDATFSVLIGRPIELVMRSGPAVAGTLLGFEADTVTIARPDGRVHTLSRGECTQVNLTVPPAPPPIAPPRADAPPRDHDEEDDDEPPSGRGMGITSIVVSSVGLVQVLGVALPFLLLDGDETLGWAALGSGLTHAFVGLGLGLGANARKRQHQAWKAGRRAHLAPSLRLDRGGLLLGLGGRF